MAEINQAEPLISVIVPVYNVENYLDKSIGSILAQTYQNLELILVDDGSKDASGAMCDAWRAKDARIRVIHQANGGQALARNHGIDEAAGAYLAFIDSDDWIAPDYLETLYRLLQEHRAEISICDKQMIYESGGQAKSSEEEDQIRDYTNREALKALFYQREIDNSPWGKLYRASLFNGVRFPEGKIYEDLGTIYRLLYQCEAVLLSSAGGQHDVPDLWPQQDGSDRDVAEYPGFYRGELPGSSAGGAVPVLYLCRAGSAGASGLRSGVCGGEPVGPAEAEGVPPGCTYGS